VDRVAGREALLGPGHHFAGHDADPSLHTERRQRVPHLHCRADGAKRVVLVQHRHAEDCHHGVPDELLHAAAVAFHRRPHPDEMLASACTMDEAGMDTIWLAEAYPWWRKHQMEARSSTVVSALIARATKQLTVGWGIISPWTRHPVQVAMDARVVQEAAGPGRFLLGYGTSKIFLNNIRAQTSKTLGPMRDAVTIVRGVLSGEEFEYEGETWSASVPALSA